jgi:hypothetical protein
VNSEDERCGSWSDTLQWLRDQLESTSNIG